MIKFLTDPKPFLLNTTTKFLEPASITIATKEELGKLFKKDGWHFKWSKVLSNEVEVYKICLSSAPKFIQGLIAINNQTDHLFLPLIETAPTNFGKEKRYDGVLLALTAFGCWLSFQYGHEGVVVFESKTQLISHYSAKLSAVLLTKNRMAILEDEAYFLVTSQLMKSHEKEY